MSMEISEKNFLEKIADAIPGLKGYRAKEERRDTDKRLREFIAARLEGYRSHSNTAKLACIKDGRLKLLDELGRVEKMIQKCADNIRYSSYGYSGFFDQMKIREQELDRLYACDNALLEEVNGLQGQMAGLPAAKTEADVEAVIGSLDRLDGAIQARHRLFDTPAAG